MYARPGVKMSKMASVTIPVKPSFVISARI
jgi:hypothetical protein